MYGHILSLKMPKELKEAWVAALRSGKYKQCTGLLKNDDGYCCLGVLQQVADGAVETRVDANQFIISEALPSFKWLKDHGIEHTHPDSTLSVLSGMNDHERKSFDEIADFIEQNVEGV